jgi:type IV pilus assembly protein PilC
MMRSNDESSMKPIEASQLAILNAAVQERSQMIELLSAIGTEFRINGNRLKVDRVIASLKSNVDAHAYLSDPELLIWLPFLLRTQPNVQRVLGSIERAGEESTFTELTEEDLDRLLCLTSNASEESETRQRIALYPIAVSAIALFVFAMLAIFAIPTFIQMFREFQLKLPLPTRVMITISELIRNEPWWFVLGLMALGLVFMVARRAIVFLLSIVESTRSFGWFLAGNTVSVNGMGRFLAVLPELLQIGMPTNQALLISGRASKSKHIAATAKRVSQSSNFSHGLPPCVVAAMSAGPNQQPHLPLLRQLSSIYLERSRHRFAWTDGMIAPMTILAVGALVGFVILAMFLPLISLITSLNG